MSPHSFRMLCSKKMPLPDTDDQWASWRHTGLSFPGFFISLGLFLQQRSAGEKLHLWVPLATWTKHRSSAWRCTASTKFSPLTQGGLGSCLSNGWFISHSTAISSPELISPCILKLSQAGQARSMGSQNHQYLSSACKGSNSNTNRCTGDNSSCFPPGNLFSYIWA